jgi:hypothetical protein
MQKDEGKPATGAERTSTVNPRFAALSERGDCMQNGCAAGGSPAGKTYGGETDLRRKASARKRTAFFGPYARDPAVRAAVCLWGLFLLSLAPMLAMARYDFPSADDFTHALMVHEALLSASHTLPMVANACAETSIYYYTHWSGTYAAVVLMSLQPGVFALQAYALVPLLMLGSLIGGTLVFLHTVLCRCLGTRRVAVALVAAPLLFLTVEYLPSVVEGFYWYNGAVYYTFYYGLMLLYVSLLIRLGRVHGMPGRIALLCGAVPLSVIIGGGNFVTALVSLLAACGLTALTALRRRENTPGPALCAAVLFAAFLLSAAAPGNGVRQAQFHHPRPAAALLRSVFFGVYDIGRWTTAAVLVVALLMVPVFYRIARKTRYEFRLPGVFILGTFLLFCAQNAPPLYAMGNVGPARLRDIVYYSYVLLLFADVFYLTGWFAKRAAADGALLRLPAAGTAARRAARIVAAAALVLGLVGALPASASAACACDLASGEAEWYGAQMESRFCTLAQSTQRDLRFAPLTARPISVYYCDLTANPGNWVNRSIADYYGKRSVVAVRPRNLPKHLSGHKSTAIQHDPSSGIAPRQ